MYFWDKLIDSKYEARTECHHKIIITSQLIEKKFVLLMDRRVANLNRNYIFYGNKKSKVHFCTFLRMKIIGKTFVKYVCSFDKFSWNGRP